VLCGKFVEGLLLATRITIKKAQGIPTPHRGTYHLERQKNLLKCDVWGYKISQKPLSAPKQKREIKLCKIKRKKGTKRGREREE
jgi:hypothetical protein